ncbi:MAG: hypothetical protein ACYCTI_02695 [Acidimicrobiales bacterium]
MDRPAPWLERGTLLGLPGRGTTWFPTFHLAAHAVRPVVARILAAFAETLGQKPDPLIVASWASAAIPSVLGEVGGFLDVQGSSFRC